MLLNDFIELPWTSLLCTASIILHSSFVSGTEDLEDPSLATTPPMLGN